MSTSQTQAAAWTSGFAGSAERHGEYWYGWRAFETRELADDDQRKLPIAWRTGINRREDVKPGSTWNGPTYGPTPASEAARLGRIEVPA